MSLPLAVCGMGRFARRRIIPALAHCARCNLTAVIDRSGKATDLPPEIQRYASLDAYLSTQPTGAVLITTPNGLHASQTIACLNAGLHVITEKPMAVSAEECQEMIQAAQSRQRHLLVGHMIRYSPAARLMQQWLQAGLIGPVQAAWGVFHYELLPGNRTWAFDPAMAGGGAMLDAGIHVIDTLRFLLGSPARVQAALSDTPQGGVELRSIARMEIGGVDCLVQSSAQAEYLTLLKIQGSAGTISAEHFAAGWGMARVKRYAHGIAEPVEAHEIDVGTTYTNELDTFSAIILENSPDFTNAQTAMENVILVEDIYRESRPLFFG